MKKNDNFIKRITLLLFLMFSLSSYSQCDYTLEMNDSYGDGWNGNSVDVLVNGTVVLDNATLNNGYTTSQTFTVNDGETISTIWNGGGSYGYETTYNILDDGGNVAGAGDESSLSGITAACGSASAYCNATPSSGDGNGISQIVVGSTIFPITMPGWYQDITGSPVQLQQGITANLDLTYAHTYGYNTWVWIDFDDDGSFDASDLVSSLNASGTLNLEFYMPAGVPLGVHRMRILGRDFGSIGTPEPCYTGSYGATVDLDVEIIEALCSPAVIAGTAINADCDNNAYSVDIDFTQGQDAQSITDGTTTWPLLSGSGVTTVGPFVNGATVNLTVVHSESACDIDLGEFVFNCPPSNDTCGSAMAVTCGSVATGTTEFATSESISFCGTTLSTAPGVWYSMEGTGGDIVLNTDDSGFDTKLGVFSGACGSLVCIDGDDDGGAGTRSEVIFSSNAGETYYIYVTGFNTNSGNYTLTVDCVCEASIVGGDCNAVYSSSFAPLASTDLTAAGQFGLAPYTYVWSDGQTGETITVSPTATTVYEVTVTDVTGCTNTAQTTVLVTDVSCSNGNGNQAKVTVCHNGDEICVSPNAVQAHLNHGDTIGSCDVIVSCDTPPLCDSRLKVPGPDAVDIPLDIEISWGASTGYILGYNLSVGTTLGGGEIIDSQDVGNTLSYSLDGLLAFGTTYYVTIVSYNNNGVGELCESSSFTTIQAPWAGEAISIACDYDTVTTVTGNTLDGNVNDYLSFCGSTINDTEGVWYTVEGTGYDITASTCTGTNFDTVVSVFSGDATAISCVGGNDDECGLQSEYSFSSIIGTTYYVYVTAYSNFSTNAGPFTLTLTCAGPPPPLQACADAIGVQCGSTINESTSGYSNNPDLGFCGTTLGTAPGRFYKIEGNGSAITVSTCGSSYDTKLGVFSGDCSALSCVSGNDDSCGLQSEVTFSSQSGSVYYIYVTGYSSSSGNFTLTVSCDGSAIVNNDDVSIETDAAATWRMYPNPATNGEVELDLTSYLNMDLEIQMLDYSGKLLINKAESNLQNPRYKMNTQNTSDGMYFVRIITDSGVSVKKLMITN